MTSLGSGSEFQVRAPFLPDTDHSEGRMHTADRLVQDHAALIEAHLEMDVLLLKPCGDLFCASAVRLFRTG